MKKYKKGNLLSRPKGRDKQGEKCKRGRFVLPPSGTGEREE